MRRDTRERALLALVTAGALLGPAAPAAGVEPPPPSPWSVLGLTLADPPALDAAGICIPSDDPQLRPILSTLDEDGVERALVELSETTDAEDVQADEGEEDATEQQARDVDVATLRAVLSARREPPAPGAADALREAATRARTARARACARLELARLELAEGRSARARAETIRALRAYGDGDEGDAPRSITRAAEHYRAESHYRDGEIEEALALYEALARGATPVARAARLRLADLRYTRTPTRDHRERVERLLRSPRGAVTSASDWGARLAEWALAEGDAAAALEWLDRVQEKDFSSAERLALSIRRADALYLLGRADEGRELLRRLSDEAATEPQRQLAMVRLIDLDSPPGKEPMAHLHRAGRSDVRGLMLYARSVLADRLLALREDEAALDVLVTIAYEKASPEILERLPGQIDQALASLASRHDCVGLLAAIGGRRTMLLKHAGAPQPFLALGDCYLELGMARAARDVYRGATRTFGPDLAKEITLRSARAEHGVGQVDTARAAARANIQLIRVPLRDWRTLYGEILIEDERPEAAIPVLVPVARDVAKGETEGAEAARAVWLLARAARDKGGTDAALRRTLRDALEALGESGTPGVEHGETLLLTADLHRRGGDRDRARALYEDAFAALGDGPLRSLAAYWRGALAEDVDGARAAWGEVAEQDDAWARLARNELRMSQTRAALGRSELNDRPSDAADEGEPE